MQRRRNITLTLFFLLGSLCVQAQHYVGVRGGWGGGNARFNPKVETAMQWGLYSGGVSYKFYSSVKYVGAIQFDLQYTGKGYVTREEPGADISYHRTINSFELPFMWQPHFYFFQRHARFFLNLGVNFSYNLDSKQWYESSEQGVYNESIYPMKLVRDARFGYGLCGGGGISVLAGRWDITFEARYSLGYSDILRSTAKYTPSPYSQSPLDNLNFSLGVYYRLGKGGLREAPSKKMVQRMEEAEARRIVRRLEKQGVPPDSLSHVLDSLLNAGKPLPEPQPQATPEEGTPATLQPAGEGEPAGESSPPSEAPRPEPQGITTPAENEK